MDLFCKKCSLQFGKKYVYDLHLKLVHGEKIEVKNEPLNSEETLKEPQTSEEKIGYIGNNPLFKKWEVTILKVV